MATPAPPHPIPSGPLAVRWLSYELGEQRAGAESYAWIELENAGSATWRTDTPAGVHLAYHWLDSLRNPILWAPVFAPLPGQVSPGEQLRVPIPVRAPIPPARYGLAFDLVDEGRFWFAEVGNSRLELDIDVGRRLEERTLAIEITEGPDELTAETRRALAAQEEPISDDGAATAYLVAGCRPEPDWSRRLLDAHAEGYAAVAGSLEIDGLWKRGVPQELEAWQPGFGRSPGWTLPLLFPSLLGELRDEAPWTTVAGELPAVEPSDLQEPWLCDGRIRVRLDARAAQRLGRRPA